MYSKGPIYIADYNHRNITMNKIYLKIKRKFKMYIVACDGPSRYKLCLDAIHNVNSIRWCSSSKREIHNTGRREMGFNSYDERTCTCTHT